MIDYRTACRAESLCRCGIVPSRLSGWVRLNPAELADDWRATGARSHLRAGPRRTVALDGKRQCLQGMSCRRVLGSWDGSERMTADSAIRAARADYVSEKCPPVRVSGGPQ